MPWCGTRKAVLRCRRRVPTGAEPREDDWDAAANCPARRKRAVGTGEEDRPLAGRLPGGQLRSLQVKLARHTVERNRGLDQPVFRFDEIENAGNAEFGSKLLGLHRSFLSREIIIADCGAPAPSRNSADRGAEDSFGSTSEYLPPLQHCRANLQQRKCF